ncbi:MAG: hypothetical protein KBT53_06575 [Porticoccus sp.]|nr:hypothetical protein [Porticoccus sp.]MBQ0807031.1 hypothetical protein [Porticoccus sp.]MDX2348771.1 hypothetical protein [Porticoccus sp.]
MSRSLFEIVVLPNGDIALKRANEKDEPLISISFSDEVQEFLLDAKMDVAKVMIDSGLELFEQLGSESMSMEEGSPEIVSPHVLH